METSQAGNLSLHIKKPSMKQLIRIMARKYCHCSPVVVTEAQHSASVFSQVICVGFLPPAGLLSTFFKNKV